MGVTTSHFVVGGDAVVTGAAGGFHAACYSSALSRTHMVVAHCDVLTAAVFVFLQSFSAGHNIKAAAEATARCCECAGLQLVKIHRSSCAKHTFMCMFKVQSLVCEH